MSELYDQIIADRGGFEKLLARIPGFRGYLDLAARRAADRQIRDYVAGMVEKQIGELVTLQKRILDRDGGLALMSDVESVRVIWQTYHDRINTAVPGYSGFFALNKIGPEELEKIYSFDEAQARYADQFAEGLTALETAMQEDSDVREVLGTLETLGREANAAFQLRDDLLLGLGK